MEEIVIKLPQASGLCNRLRTIFHFYNKLKKNETLTVVWYWCSGGTPGEFFDYFNKLPNLNFTKDTVRPILYMGNGGGGHEGALETPTYKQLKPNKIITDIVDLEKENLKNNYIAIHLRQTDFVGVPRRYIEKQAKFLGYTKENYERGQFDIYFNFINKHPGKNLYISSDNEQSYNLFYNKYKDTRIINSNIIFLNSNLRRNTSLKDAIVDLYMCISADYFQGAKYSSFTDFIKINRMDCEARKFTYYVQSIFEKSFNDKKVLDVGGGYINSNNKSLFNNCEYHVNDVVYSPNVTVMKQTKDLLFNNEEFDTIISTECLERDPEYKKSFQKIIDMLKPGGLFLFTCASFGRDEYKTPRTRHTNVEYDGSYDMREKTSDSLDYYKNLTEIDIKKAIPLDSVFGLTYRIYYNLKTYDLYFFGIKENGDTTSNTFISYDNGEIYTDVDKYRIAVREKKPFILDDDTDGSLSNIRRNKNNLKKRDELIKQNELINRNKKKLNNISFLDVAKDSVVGPIAQNQVIMKNRGTRKANNLKKLDTRKANNFKKRDELKKRNEQLAKARKNQLVQARRKQLAQARKEQLAQARRKQLAKARRKQQAKKRKEQLTKKRKERKIMEMKKRMAIKLYERKIMEMKKKNSGLLQFTY